MSKGLEKIQREILEIIHEEGNLYHPQIKNNFKKALLFYGIVLL